MAARLENAFRLVKLVLDGTELAQQRADVAFGLKALQGEPEHMNLGLHAGETILKVIQGLAKLPLIPSKAQLVPLRASLAGMFRSGLQIA